MKIIKVTKEYYETEDEKVYFYEPLETEISVEEMQKILDSNVELLKKLKGETHPTDTARMVKDGKGDHGKTPKEHSEEKKIIENLKITVEENFEKKEQFVKELTHLINRLGLDSRCETPDYIIAELLYEFFDSFVTAMDKKNLIKSSEDDVLQQLTCGHMNFIKFEDTSRKCTICGVGTIKEGK